MRKAQFTLPYLEYLLVLVLGVGLGMCVPVESHAQQIVHILNHSCQTITCANVTVSGTPTCPAPGWCTDNATPGQFPKCMPQMSIDCDESAKWGTKNCGSGICVPGGAACGYTLNFCIPPGP